MLGRGFTSKSKAPHPTIPLPAAKGWLGSSASAGWPTRFTTPVVPSHARQGHYPQIKSTPPNPPLACGKRRARFLGIGRWKSDLPPTRRHCPSGCIAGFAAYAAPTNQSSSPALWMLSDFATDAALNGGLLPSMARHYRAGRPDRQLLLRSAHKKTPSPLGSRGRSFRSC